MRATYASCLAALAQAAARFLDITQILKSEGAVTSRDTSLENGSGTHAYQDLYDAARLDLIRFFEKQTKALLTDSHADVRRAFLSSVSSLCSFFGSARANDVILSHLNTYLNDRDWRLKSDFFETIVGVAIYVGSTNLEEFILPLMVQALTDSEDSVVEKVIRSLATMQKLGLLQRSKTWELVDLIARFTIHPNTWIREAAAYFLSASTTYLTAADCECIMKPLLEPYLRSAPASLEEHDLLDSIKKPLSRQLLEMASSWALKPDGSSFWKPSQTRSFATLTGDRLRLEPSVPASPPALSKTHKTDEDVQWLSRMRNCGMSTEDDFKLLALRDYIWRSARSRLSTSADDIGDRFNRVVGLTTLGINIETVFFAQEERFITRALPDNDEPDSDKPSQTIADAMLDASTAIEGPGRPKALAFATSSKPKHDAPRALSSDKTAKHSPRVHSPLGASPNQAEPHMAADRHASAVSTDRKVSLRPVSGSGQISRSSTSSSLDRPKVLQEAGLHRKGSAISLLQKRSMATKAEAAISTTSTTAQGQNDSHYSGHEPSRTPYNTVGDRQDGQRQFQEAHDYSGRDPNVLKLLDSVYLDKFPMDNVEFGPLITPARSTTQEIDPNASANRTWQPTGSLVAVFGEHTGPINRVLPSPDHLFFLTASDDGEVRIWDSARLEQNLAHRSKQVYKHSPGVKVTALCFIESTHCFVSAGDDGSVHVIKVETTETAQGALRYGKPKVLRRWRIPDADASVVWLEHYREESRSVLLIATSACTVIALDLRSMEMLYVLNNPRQHGTPTCFCVDSDKLWLLLGTSTGCLDLWDLRFHVRLKQWQMSGKTPVHRLLLHPAPPERFTEGRERGPKKRQKLVCAIGGTGNAEVTIWDIETKACAGVLRASHIPVGKSLSSQIDPSKRYALTDLDSASSDPKPNGVDDGHPLDSTSHGEQSSHDIRTIAIGSLTSTPNGAPSDPYFVTAGPDLNVRYWNINHIQQSCIVSGPGASDAKQNSIASHSRFRRADKTALLPIYEEQIVDPTQDTVQEKDVSSKSSEGRRSRANVGAKRSATSSVASNSQMGSSDRPEMDPPPRQERKRHTMISDQQQKLLRSHLDIITDLAVLEYPKRMIVSVDRSGVIYVFS